MDFKSLREKLRELDFDTWDIIERAALSGDAEAQFLMGSKVYSCLGDNRVSRKWLRAAARQSHAEAIYSLARTKFGPGQQVHTRSGGPIGPNRLRHLILAAELGSPSAQTEWGGYLTTGYYGFDKDLSKARSLFLQAATGGDLDGQISAGWMLTQGEGGPQQLEEGIALLEAVADGQDHLYAADAARALADVYCTDKDKRSLWQSRSGQSRQKWQAERTFREAVRELELAAEAGDCEKVRELLATGVPGDTMDAGWTPLMESASRADLAVSRLLLEAGADVMKALEKAVTSRRSRTPDLLRLFLEFGCPAQKLLYEAVWLGRPKDVQAVLDKGDLNLPDDSGYSPLFRAAQNSAAMVRLLLARGADPSRIAPRNHHPLIHCAILGYTRRLKTLLQVEHSGEVLENALVHACSQGHIRCALALLVSGANVNPDKWTPLMAASAQGSLALVNWLLERGADPTRVDGSGKTARDYALEFTTTDFYERAVRAINGDPNLPIRHRWSTDSITGEPILQLRREGLTYRRTHCHSAIVERLNQVTAE